MLSNSPIIIPRSASPRRGKLRKDTFMRKDIPKRYLYSFTRSFIIREHVTRNIIASYMSKKPILKKLSERFSNFFLVYVTLENMSCPSHEFISSVPPFNHRMTRHF